MKKGKCGFRPLLQNCVLSCLRDEAVGIGNTIFL